jgi:hypothetical protein
VTPEQTVERAEALLELDRGDEAVAVLTARLAEAPDDHRAWVSLARCHSAAERREEALAAADEALRHQPDHVYALYQRAQALRGLGRAAESMDTLRAAIPLAPHDWYPRAMLAEMLAFRASQLRQGAGEPAQLHEAGQLLEEASTLAQDGIRLGPEETGAYMSAWKVATVDANFTVQDQLEKAILRIDPTHSFALGQQTSKAARAPGTRAADTADRVADALAATPQNVSMRGELDRATYRLLRGTRWLALLCLLCAALGLDLVEGRRELPLPLGQRLWDVLLLAAVWAVGGVLRLRRRRAGVRLNVRSLLRRDGWARLALGQAVAVTACAAALLLVPWTTRAIPSTVCWIVLGVTLLTMYVDRWRLRRI